MSCCYCGGHGHFPEACRSVNNVDARKQGKAGVSLVSVSVTLVLIVEEFRNALSARGVIISVFVIK